MDSIASRLDLRQPNAGALESIAAAVTHHYNEGGQPPFEAVVDLATAVGKTYIMAAGIEYFAAQGYRNFAIIAPGKTILRKTVSNFTAGHPKSLLAGMEVQPVVITSENFATPVMRAAIESDEEVKLFVFTVQALLKPESETGRRTRKFQEGLGKAFYDHLQELDDLIVFADEHHTYYGKAFSAAIRELVPRALIGLTATPAKATPEKQIIYRYPLAAAIADKLVKTPVLVGRKDDRVDVETKLRDGVRLLEAKAKAVESYCAATGLARVNPVMLVVAPTIEEANKLEAILTSPDFFGGEYTDKILNINSDSPEEALDALDKVEDPQSPVRVIVSVGMLKEGWDVKSVYVIASMRPSISEILTEQTLGRGLRLPFGQYTGIELLDTLEVVAHEKYQELLKKAGAINEAFVDYRTWVGTTKNAQGQEVVVIETATAEPGISGEDGSEPPAPIESAPTATVTSVEARTQHVELEIMKLAVQVAPKAGLPPLEIPKLTMKTVTSEWSLADITNTDRFLLLGQKLASDPEGELWRTKVSARIIEGTDGLRHTQLITSEAVDKISAQVPLLAIEDAIARLADMVLLAPMMTSRLGQRAALAPILDALLKGLGSHAQEVLSLHLERVGRRVMDLILEEQRGSQVKPSYQEVVSLEAFAPVRTGRAETTSDRLSKFERSVGYEGWQRSMYEQDWFDSGTERDAANVVDASDDVEFWVRLNTGDCPILWNGMNQLYNPDFIVVEKAGTHWIVEIKMEKEISSADVLGKAEAARRWVNHVNASEMVKTKWAYLLVAESDVEAAKGSWSALKSLNRV